MNKIEPYQKIRENQSNQSNLCSIQRILHSQAGFSLLEMLVSATIMLMLFAMVATAFLQTRKISLRRQLEVENLQNARIAINEMSRTLRMIGFQRDRKNGQVALIEAAPFQMIFNADLSEDYEALLPGTALSFLYDAGDYVSPLQNYTSGAETIRWTLDSSNDGLVDKVDTNDKPEERLSPNPDDITLIREINGGADEPIVLGLLGPYDAQDRKTYVTPMFQYWLRDGDLNLRLLGDEDGNGKLENDERYFGSVTDWNVLKYVEHIDISITAAAPRKDPFDHSSYRQVNLTSTIFLRNMR